MGRNFGRRSYNDDDDYYDDDKYYGSDDEFETSDLEDPDAKHERLVSEVRAGLEDRSSLVSEDMITETLLMVNNDSDKALECILRGYLDKQLLETLACSILNTLAEDAKHTNKMAIKDSLYHYYYNEQKALAYVKKQILTQKNKAEAEAARIRNIKKKPSIESERQESDELMGNIKAKGFRKPQSKKLDVIELYKQRVAHEKRTCSFVVAGHVDAGKSTLMGRLLMEVGAVDQYSVSKNESDAAKIGKKSFGLAWVMDQREEERERGVTIDIATNFFETEKTKFTVLDAPGHQDFVPNMISGSSQADFAVLVIDSNTNAFERGLKGQTLEHILLLRSLGIQRIIIAVNKLDMVGWSQERYEEIVEHVRAFMLKLSFPPHTISFIPICGQDGTNVAKKPIHDSSLDWYSGETLVEALESVRSPKKVLDRPMRIAVSETFTTGFAGLTVSGRIQVGTLQIGDELVVASSRAPLCYVKSILVGEEARDWAVAGDLVDIVVVGIEDTEIQPGDVLSISSNPVNLSREFSLKALAFKPLMADTIDLHRGRNHSSGCIIATPAILDKANGVAKKINPTRVQEGEVARITVVVNHPIAIDPGQRVVLRKDGETIAAGVVEQ